MAAAAVPDESTCRQALSSCSHPHPRWLRISTVRSSLAVQLATTFREYARAASLAEVLAARSDALIYHVDEHVPDLLALPPGASVGKMGAYQRGEVVVQDKASCFPAYLLGPRLEDGDGGGGGGGGGDVLDACAAPGNKTTHLAALLEAQLRVNGTDSGSKTPATASNGSTMSTCKEPKVFAVERDPNRAQTLKKMVAKAGCAHRVQVYAGVDFLTLNPAEKPWRGVTAILLDPSCSGSGIVGRDDGEDIENGEKGGAIGAGVMWRLPRSTQSEPLRADIRGKKRGKKRKRNPDDENTAPIGGVGAVKANVNDLEEGNEDKAATSNSKSELLPIQQATPENKVLTPLPSPLAENSGNNKNNNKAALQRRLASLSSLQTKMLLHAFSFPSARRITYSTCSIYDAENEHVIVAALGSVVARRRGWRILRREEQAPGLRAWDVRGRAEACGSIGRGVCGGKGMAGDEEEDGKEGR
ncbi:MAG: hypothetical protein LQ340_008061, partial [Diploschistes diacapsis]